MTNRWIRLLLAVLAIAAASAAAYRVLQHEQQLARDRAAAQAATLAADTALAAADELKSALHAYVAPGQAADFWMARAGLLLDKLRNALLELDAPAATAGAPVAETLDAVDRLASAEQRARTHVSDQQPLLAGEVIFTDGRDLLDAVRIQVARSRDRIGAAASQRELSLRREQMYLLLGGVGVLALVMLLLVPIATAAPVAPPAREPAPEDVTPRSVAPWARPGATAIPSFDTPELAAICTEIAALTESDQITPLLDRTRELLHARGVIVWVTKPDSGELTVAAASGYDDRVLARIGSIARDAVNITADAFRGNDVRTSAPTATATAAIAIPLPAPGGPAGVFSAELMPGFRADEEKASAARVIAAQIGAVVGATAVKQDEAADPASTASVQSSP